MAQLPPRVPSMTPNWPEFAHPKIIDSSPPSWVDEFLDFSSSKRGSHRRSISDSIAFLEAPMVEECRRLSTPEFDDEQQLLMSMFNDDHPSSPSDHNSDNIMNIATDQEMQLKTEPEEVESSCKSDASEKIVDPKRIKRILANRQSAQRSRVRKLQYISELERSVTTLQAQVSVLSPRVAFLDHQRLVLNVDNSVLKQRIAALAQDKIFKDAHQEALKREIERLRQIYYQQNLKKIENDENPKSQHSEKKEELVNS